MKNRNKKRKGMSIFLATRMLSAVCLPGYVCNWVFEKVKCLVLFEGEKNSLNHHVAQVRLSGERERKYSVRGGKWSISANSVCQPIVYELI